MIVLDNKNAFSYRYSARENEEIKEIRKKYLPREESKFEELIRLDRNVQTAGIMQALILGVLGSLLFGVGLCLVMKIIGDSLLLGIVCGIIGTVGIILAYPVRVKLFGKAKAKFAPRILQLSEELSKSI